MGGGGGGGGGMRIGDEVVLSLTDPLCFISLYRPEVRADLPPGLQTFCQHHRPPLPPTQQISSQIVTCACGPHEDRQTHQSLLTTLTVL